MPIVRPKMLYEARKSVIVRSSLRVKLPTAGSATAGGATTAETTTGEATPSTKSASESSAWKNNNRSCCFGYYIWFESLFATIAARKNLHTLTIGASSGLSEHTVAGKRACASTTMLTFHIG